MAVHILSVCVWVEAVGEVMLLYYNGSLKHVKLYSPK